jgi:hypothetical protein
LSFIQSCVRRAAGELRQSQSFVCKLLILIVFHASRVTASWAFYLNFNENQAVTSWPENGEAGRPVAPKCSDKRGLRTRKKGSLIFAAALH